MTCQGHARRLAGLLVGGLLVSGCTPLWFVTAEDIERRRDRDGDGWAAQEAGGSDCDDTDPSVNRDAPEVCGDGVDNDCNGLIDNYGEGAVEYFYDDDGDGYGQPTLTRQACDTWPLLHWVRRTGDCDDQDPAVHPHAADIVCNDVDDDCDGIVDNGGPTFHPDLDGDGFGAVGSAPSCVPVTGWVRNADDCDDETALANPGAVEVCDGIDNNCDQRVDEGGGASIGTTRYPSLQAAWEAAQATGNPVSELGICAQAAPHELAAIDVRVGETLILRGPGPAGALVEAPPDGTLIEVADGGVLEIDGLMIKGRGTQPTLVVDGSADLTNVVLFGSGGSGVSVRGRLFAHASELRDNASVLGGAVAVHEGGDVVLQESVLTGNSSVFGGAVWVDEAAGLLEVRSCDFGTGLLENKPDDVALGTESLDVVGAGHSFVCERSCR